MVTHAQYHHSEPSVIHAGCKYASPYWQNLGVHLRALISFPPCYHQKSNPILGLSNTVMRPQQTRVSSFVFF